MIKNYYRAESIENAVSLLAQENIDIRPMGGGTKLNILVGEEFSVVDLQDLNLKEIHKKGNLLKIGALVTLNQLKNEDGLPDELKLAINLQDNQNLRNVGTVVGAMMSADGRSTFANAMLTLDAQFVWAPNNTSQSYGEYLAIRKSPKNEELITDVSFSIGAKFAFESVGRSPADLPIVSVGVAKWSSGRTRIVLGGYGKAPMMVMDGQEQGGAVEVVASAFMTATDQWATAEYRVATAQVLVRRCLDRLEN